MKRIIPESDLDRAAALLRAGTPHAAVALETGISERTLTRRHDELLARPAAPEQAPEAPAEDDGPRLSTSPPTPAVAVMEAILRAPADAPPTDDDLRRIAELHVEASDGGQTEQDPAPAADCTTVPPEATEAPREQAPEAPREPAAAPSPRIKGRVKMTGGKARLRLSASERDRLHIAAADLWLRGIRSPEAMLEKEKPLGMVSIPKIKEWIAEFAARDLAALVAAGEIDHRLLTLFKHSGRPAIKAMVDRHRAAEAVRVPGAPPPKTRKRRKLDAAPEAPQAPPQAPPQAEKTPRKKSLPAMLVRDFGDFQRLGARARLRALARAAQVKEAEMLRQLALIGLHVTAESPEGVNRALNEARAAMAGVQS